ncbi:MAG: hypothetical protein ABI288_08575 [Ginsengibacter sp.]
MKQQDLLLKGIDSLSEQEKMDLFKVEELEERLEMARPTSDPNPDPGTPVINIACWFDGTPIPLPK